MRSRVQSTAGFAVLVALLLAAPPASAQAGPVNSYAYDETGNITRQQLACTPVTCLALGKNCGTIADGCGGTLWCGDCGAGWTCSASNVCTCTPTTCAVQGKNCGSISDGCGKTLSCGSCSTGQVCTAWQVCCAPTTCAAQLAECGSISNGCGGTLQCGSCPTGSSCIANACTEPTCFVTGTPITMVDGSAKPIEQIAAGDSVLSFDPENGTLAEGRVETLLEHPATPALVRINGYLTTTPEHRFFVEGAWMRADHLRLGDGLMRPWPNVGAKGSGAGFVVVRQLESLPGGVTTYNFDVVPLHNYFAGGVLVHNMKPGP